MRAFAGVLQSGDRRSIGRSDAVVAAVRRQPQRVAELWACLRHADPLVRMRSADALEKLTRLDPSSLCLHKKALLGRAYDDGTAEVRWHLLAMIARLPLDRREARAELGRLTRCFGEEPSRIVQVMALQAAADIVSRHPALRPVFDCMLGRARASPWPSVRARARKLVASTAGKPR